MQSRMSRAVRWSITGFMLLTLFTTFLPNDTFAAAPKDVVAKEDQKVDLTIKKVNREKYKKKEGWFPKLSLGVNMSLAHAANVPGVDDGVAFSLGVVINGSLLYLKDQHEWKTDLTAIHTQTKTPTIDPFVKTADNFDLGSFYTYRFKSKYKIGIFGGLNINTALFPTNLVVASDTNYVKVNADGTKVGTEDPNNPGTIIPEVTRLQKNIALNLTGPFNPFIFKQKLGVSSKPYEDKLATLDLKVSLAAQQVFASGLTVQDDAATPELELRLLQDYVQLGMELNIGISGNISKRVIYEFKADLMLPFVTSIPTNLSGFELLNADLSFKVGVKLAKWASLDYVFRALRVPLLTNKWQVTNNLVLNIKADFL